ncbi:MAG: S-methyl-5-thioribose kinase, partial [Chitinophagaceae bacterium]|nr:S-methyl-5-thioribose kinase [Anaerolineae bacterium]
MSQEYFPLEPLSVIEYVKRLDAVRDIFSTDEDLTAEEIGDGNLNLVFKIRAKADPKRTVVVKQSLPYMRLVGDEWPLPIERARIEAQALQIEARLCPEHTPHVYHFDPVMYAIVMQNLDNHIIMRKGLSAGIQYPHFADHIGKFLAKTLGYTSDLILDYRTKKEQVGR